MADDISLRQTALQFALEIADLCDNSAFCDCNVSETTGDVLAAADLVLAWLNTPDKPVTLVLSVGPVTEQL